MVDLDVRDCVWVNEKPYHIRVRVTGPYDISLVCRFQELLGNLKKWSLCAGQDSSQVPSQWSEYESRFILRSTEQPEVFLTSLLEDFWAHDRDATVIEITARKLEPVRQLLVGQ